MQVHLLLPVVLKHVVVAFKHIRDVFAKASSRLERCVLNRSTNRGGAHDFDSILLLLTHRKIPVLKGVLLAEAVVSGATDLLNFTSKIHHLQSVFVVSSWHGRIVAPSRLEVTRRFVRRFVRC